jgi:hypothetical protein
MPRVLPPELTTRIAVAVLSLVLVACGATATSTDAESDPGTGASGVPAATPGPVGARLGVLPGVEGFAYRDQPGIVPAFVAGAEESLQGAAEIRILQAAIASRDDEEVAIIAFGFPGADDAQAVDYMARILDGMEDGFQAAAERGLDGEAYVMTFDGQSVVVAPWAHTEDGELIFLFFSGPTEATQQLAATILNQLD